MSRWATAEEQLLGATAQGRSILTFNLGAFLALTQRHPHHGGIILAAQRSWALPDLIAALDRVLSETCAAEWVGQARWLNQWK